MKLETTVKEDTGKVWWAFWKAILAITIILGVSLYFSGRPKTQELVCHSIETVVNYKLYQDGQHSFKLMAKERAQEFANELNGNLTFPLEDLNTIILLDKGASESKLILFLLGNNPNCHKALFHIISNEEYRQLTKERDGPWIEIKKQRKANNE